MQTSAAEEFAESQEVVVIVGTEQSVYPLPRSGRMRLGRAKDNDVCIEHASISRHHAILHLGPPLWIEDLGSANGTAIAPPGKTADTVGTASVRRGSGESFGFERGDSILLGAVTCVVRMARPRLAELSQSGIRLAPPSSNPGVIVRDPAMRALYEEAHSAADSALSILLLGETGVGKEVLARAIHRASPRNKGPFLAIHCGAISDSLLEAELFGHERGAFTGAMEARPGLLEAADGGTLFLDEVGELGALAQMKILRVLEERAVMRVGGRSTRPVDVRFVAATNRDLEAEVRRGGFREDLYYRLNGIILTIPPLRERRSEIIPLAEMFLVGACKRSGRVEVPRFASEALSVLERYAWPGNVRELRNVVERAAVVVGAGGEVRGEHFPAKVRAESVLPPASVEVRGAYSVRSQEELRAAGQALEKTRILDALEECGGNQTRAAEMLGMSRRTLVNRLEEFGLPRPRKK